MHMLGLQMTEDELKDVVDEFDADKSGTIEYSEFWALMARKMKEVRHRKRASYVACVHVVKSEELRSLYALSDHRTCPLFRRQI